MYSKIIQLAPRKLSKEEIIRPFDVLCDDVYLAHSSGIAAEVPLVQNLDVIAMRLRPVAFVNKRKRTITFKKKGAISRLYLRNLMNVYRKAKDDIYNDLPGSFTHEDVIHGIECVGVTHYLFYYQPLEGCLTLSELLAAYLNGDIPKTLRFGGVIGYNEKVPVL